MENFYDVEQFNESAAEHYRSLKRGELDPQKAVLLTKAYAQSHHISSFFRDVLIKETIVLPGLTAELKDQLPLMIKSIYTKIRNEPAGDRRALIEMIQSIEQTDGVKYFLLGSLNLRDLDFEKAKENFMHAMDSGYVLASSAIAIAFEFGGELEQAEHYLRYAYEHGISKAAFDLAEFYYNHNRNRDRALVILQEAVNEGERDMESIVLLYILKIWNGIFEPFNADKELLCNMNDKSALFLIKNLLIHYQTGIVAELFFGTDSESFVSRFQPLFYVFQLLLDDVQGVRLRIPPELVETVDILMLDILKRRDFYYHNNEAGAFLQQRSIV